MTDPLARMAARMGMVKPSPILAMVRKTAELKRAGVDVIDLGIGEPDFDTPDNVKNAAEMAIRAGKTKYTPAAGIAELRDAIALKFKRDNALDYRPDEITIGTGGKQVIFNAILATVDPGDEVVIPTPYWASYPDIALIAGGTPVHVPCLPELGFQPDLATLEKAIGARTRWLILNSPSNPSGGVLSAATLQAIATILRRNSHVLVMTDDMYEHFNYGGEFRNILNIAPDLRERTLVVNGVSKSYSMTGWRLGYGAGPARLIEAMTTLQGHATTHPSSISQAAAIEALTGPQEGIARRREAFRRRGAVLRERIDAIQGMSCATGAGAFYLYPSCAGLIGRRTPLGATLVSDVDVATYFLEQAQVSTVHGRAFGASPFLRLSYAASEEALAEAAARLHRAVDVLS